MLINGPKKRLFNFGDVLDFEALIFQQSRLSGIDHETTEYITVCKFVLPLLKYSTIYCIWYRHEFQYVGKWGPA